MKGKRRRRERGLQWVSQEPSWQPLKKVHTSKEWVSCRALSHHSEDGHRLVKQGRPPDTHSHVQSLLDLPTRARARQRGLQAQLGCSLSEGSRSSVWGGATCLSALLGCSGTQLRRTPRNLRIGIGLGGQRGSEAPGV